MIRLFAAASLLLLAAAPAAHALDRSPAYDKCLAKVAAQNTAGIVACSTAELKVQDARLNAAYQSALARLERPRQKMTLQKAQRAWIAFRDADCATFYDTDWGTVSRIDANICLLQRTQRRAEELEQYRKFD